ncbi:MAG TPA: hypothetical protein VG186_14940 [Solirubrobacteraceae bacterium]|jgi:hypothetical protein|nr:hypothetical protein [Solirubrobacteraceae bacterium]
MSTALDHFERELVKASERLHAQAQPVSPAPSRSRGLVRRARQLSAAVQVGLAVSTVSALGGTAAWLFLSGEHTKSLASVECNTSRRISAIINTVTGDPVVDCATAWASATAGAAAAPPLTAWGRDTGRDAAVVQPTSWGPPRGGGWRRLPVGWTVNLGVVELTDQLGDISTSLSGAAMGPSGGPSCSYARSDEALVRSLLEADGLGSWRVVANPSVHPAGPPAGCRVTTPIVDAGARTVELVQGPPVPRSHLTPGERAGALANRRLATLAKRVNGMLATRCQSVDAAAALWVSQASVAGFRTTTLAYYRALNRAPNPGVRLSSYYYTLVKQPATQHTGRCAHVLVMRAGGGATTVYAARITP